MVDRSGKQRQRETTAECRTENSMAARAVVGPCTRKLALMPGSGAVRLPRCVLAPKAMDRPHKIRELRCQPIGWARSPHINLGLSCGRLDSPTHEKRIQHQLLFEDRTRQLTCNQKVKMVRTPPITPKNLLRTLPRHPHRSILRPASPQHQQFLGRVHNPANHAFSPQFSRT